MEKFIDLYKGEITGVLSGIDRIILKGHISSFYQNNGFYYFLSKEGILLKGFKEYVLQVTGKIKSDIEEIIKQTGCYYEYFRNSGVNKEKLASKILKENTKEGLVCILSAVEPCYCLSVTYNKITGNLEKSHEYRKCQHYYFYYNDKELGLMHVRLQTWFPFTIQIYLNGKEYLKKQLSKHKIRFKSYDNSVTWVEDVERAQKIADKFIDKKWYATFDSFASKVNSFLPKIKRHFNGKAYDWCIEQCEYATDVMFKRRERLEQLMPKFIEYASLCQLGEDVYTFFGRKIHGLNQGDAVSDRKNYFGQGFRVKFKLDRNSLKLYDKYNVLRIETTINNPGAFKVFKASSKRKWTPMGKRISNMYRFAEVSKACNYRYLNSLSEVIPPNDLSKKLEKISNPTFTTISSNSKSEKRYSGFNLLLNYTSKVFEAINNGAYAIKGFTNKLLRNSLIEMKAFNEPITDIKKLSAKITRLIRKLRAHKIISKIPNTSRYRVNHAAASLLNQVLLFKKQELVFKIC